MFLTERVKLYLLYDNIEDICNFIESERYYWIGIYYHKVTTLSPSADLHYLSQIVSVYEILWGVTKLDITIQKKKLGLFLNGIKNLSSSIGLPNLTWLGLGNNSIENISPLAWLDQLNQLDLRNNYIEDITILKKMTRMEKLDLSYNHVKDLSPIAGMTNLIWLRKDGNPLP
jgi:internalin A